MYMYILYTFIFYTQILYMLFFFSFFFRWEGKSHLSYWFLTRSESLGLIHTFSKWLFFQYREKKWNKICPLSNCWSVSHIVVNCRHNIVQTSRPFSSFVTETLYTLSTNSLFPLPIVPGNSYSIFFFLSLTTLDAS